MNLLGRAGLCEIKLHFVKSPLVFGAVDADGNLVGGVDRLCLTVCRESFLVSVIGGHDDSILNHLIMTNSIKLDYELGHSLL